MRGDHLVAALRSLGHEAELIPDGGDASGADAALLQGGAHWYPGIWKLPRERRPRIVLWHTEPLPLPSTAGLPLARRHPRELAKVVLRDSRRSDPRSNVQALRRVLRERLVDVVVVSTYERKLYLAEQGLDVPFVPLGYDPVTHGSDRKRARDIDVLFLGALDVPRRRSLLRRLKDDGVSVRALGDWSDARLWGEDRSELLNRTKILLNLPRHPGMLSGGRMVLGVGVGYLEPEFRAIGADFERRGAVTDEHLDAMHHLWYDEHPEFHGRFFSIPNSVALWVTNLSSS